MRSRSSSHSFVGSLFPSGEWASSLGALALTFALVSGSACAGSEQVGVSAPEPTREGFVTPPETGVRLWYARVGVARLGTVVFLNGSDANAAMWDEDFLAHFLDAGFEVVRYDARDNGRSQWLPWPTDFDVDAWTPEDPPPYPLTAHTEDLVGLMNSLGLDRVHLVGVSMGGMVAQDMALEHPARVASLALLSTSPSNSFDPKLAPADPAFFQELAAGWRAMGFWSVFQRLWSRPLASRMTETFLLFLPDPSEQDRKEMRQLIDRLLSHAPHNPRSAQGLAIAARPSAIDRLPEIAAPTLVIHGDADGMFPLPHGEALAERIPGARLVIVPGLGHGLPVSGFAPFREAILANAARSLEK